MNYRLISLFHSLLDDLITGCRYKNAHKRADDIKDAIREISPSRYAEDCRLRHAASRPRDQHGGDGDGVFRCPAKQAALESPLLIYFFKHFAVQDDGDKLVRRADVQG